MPLTQQERMLKLNTPLGDDVLLLTGFSGREEISQLFRFQLDMISDETEIAATDIVGQSVTFSLGLSDGSARFFNGFVSQFAAGDEFEGRRNYRAMVVPWLWFLTQTADCRLFQDQTIEEIIETIFGDLGFSDYKFDLQLDHKTWEYCVQYRETDFNFVSRLLEQEGAAYWFKHDNGKHEMVICDHVGGYYDLPEKEVEYPPEAGSAPITDHITSWEHQYEFRPGKWAQTDYNFKTPTTSLMSNEPSVLSLPGADDYEIYDYPGAYAKKEEGKVETKTRIEEQEAGHNVVQAASRCKTFSPGGKFTTTVHRCSSEEGKSFAITAIEHEASEPLAYETGEASGEPERDYSNSFTCIPDSVVFRPPRVTQKPLVTGVQTAVVTGPAGEEIYPDEFGRVKVQFHWDREGQYDENSSCWIRVSQSHAGKGFGAISLPRIGEEVIVDFLEGDPDRPIITGRVYHAESMPPYGLPDSKNISGMKSNSTKGGGGYNEYVMDDTKGNELIREHAQFDKDSTVENDLREHVLNNRSRDVSVDETIEIGSNQTITVGANQSTSVGADQSTSVAANQSNQIDADQSTVVGANQTTAVTSNRSADVGSEDKLTVGASRTTSISADDSLSVGGTLKQDATGAIEISSASVIRLSVGGSGIEIAPGGIKIASSGIVEIQGAVIKENC